VEREIPRDPGAQDDVTAAVINFNTAGLTQRCVRSLLDAGIARILVLDNASAPADYDRLRADHAGEASVRVLRSEENLGFAGGSNRLIEQALRDPACRRVLLVNSDAIANASGIAACLERMSAESRDLMGARMLKPGPPGAEGVDSLGVTLYKSLLASNRMSTADAYLGPTGGLAVYTRRFLEEIVRLHGYVFDPSYFCYAEDTDLCVRARLAGFSAGYSDETAAWHEGQASTTGEYSDFILYHGIRNSIWMVAKSIPGALVALHLPWILALHAGIVLRHLTQGRARTLLRLYVDAAKGLPAALRARKVVQASRRVSLAEFRSHIDRKFYETRYVKAATRELFRWSR
jgi:GT2 family glycosyltransferase